MERRILLLIIVLCVSATIAGAQIISVDKFDTTTYTRKTIATLNVASGAEIDKQLYTLVDATNTMDASLEKSHELFILSASERFTYDENQSFLNTGYVHLRYRHNYKNKIHFELFAQHQWDEKLGLVRRSLAGGNIRYNFYKQDKLELTAATGLMYEEEEWDYDAVDSNEIPANPQFPVTHYIKSTSYVKCDWKASANSNISFTVFLQERPDAFFNHVRIAHAVHWVVAAGKHVNIDINYSGMYDPHPIVPISNYYYSLATSLLFHFGPGSTTP